MDELDLIICKALIREPRISYRSLGKIVGISSVAAHKRVQELRDSGIINGSSAEIDIRALRGASIMVFGRTGISSPTLLHQVLGSDEHTSMILIGSGNYVFIGAMLRSISELERYLEFVRREGQIPRAVAGLHTIRPSGVRMTDIKDPGEISPLEMRIIASMRKDARKQAVDIARELGLSARMISSKLESMLKQNKINLTTRWRPDYSSDTVALICMRLKEGEDKQAVSKGIYQRFASNVVFLSSFSNLPDLVISTAWARSPKGIASLADDLLAEGTFQAIVPHTICEGYFLETWKERLLDGVLEGRAGKR